MAIGRAAPLAANPVAAPLEKRAEWPQAASTLLFNAELVRVEGRSEARAELIALNAVLRAFGAPSASFGQVAGVAPGRLFARRAELCVAGIHRHFLSHVSATPLGIESFVIDGSSGDGVGGDGGDGGGGDGGDGDMGDGEGNGGGGAGCRCEDSGETIRYSGCGSTAAEIDASLQELHSNVRYGCVNMFNITNITQHDVYSLRLEPTTFLCVTVYQHARNVSPHPQATDPSHSHAPSRRRLNSPSVYGTEARDFVPL